MMKTNRRYHISYLIIASMAFLVMGCSKWLERADLDPSNLSPESYYTTPDQAEAALGSVYAQTRFINDGAGIFANNFSMLEMVTGTARTETGQNTDLNNLLGLTYNGENVFVGNWWNGLYSVIAQANLVIQKVPDINPMDETQKQRIIGQAKFLRAWSYFYLVRLYGDVPLILSPVDAASPDLNPGRTPAEQVYELIVKDLQDAEQSNLPWTDPSGRVSLGAVKSELAEVYLTMAGFPLNKGTSYYKLAADKALEVISSGSFQLFADYSDLHNELQDNRGEHIFQIQYAAGIANNPNQGILLPNFQDISAYGTEIGSTVPTNEFYESYEPGDLRTVDRQGFFYTHYYSGGNGPLKDLSAPYIYKFFDVVANGTFGVPGTATSGLNWPNIRYAQVLLTYAEAQNEADGAPNTTALSSVNQIRSRAQIPLIGSMSQTSFRDAVLRERWHEMCYEGVTWFDMIRLRKVFNEATNGFDDFVGHKLPENDAQLEAKHLLFPLPTAEMQNNTNLRPQNTGY